MTQALIIAASAAGTLLFYLSFFYFGRKVVLTATDSSITEEPDELTWDEIYEQIQEEEDLTEFEDPIDLLLDRVEEVIKEDPDGWFPWALHTEDRETSTRGTKLVGFEYAFEQAIGLDCKACGIFIEPSGSLIYRDHSRVDDRYFKHRFDLEEDQVDRVKDLAHQLMAERGIRLLDRGLMEKADKRSQQKQKEKDLILAACFSYREQLNAEFNSITDQLADWDEFLFLTHQLDQIEKLMTTL